MWRYLPKLSSASSTYGMLRPILVFPKKFSRKAAIRPIVCKIRYTLVVRSIFTDCPTLFLEHYCEILLNMSEISAVIKTEILQGPKSTLCLFIIWEYIVLWNLINVWGNSTWIKLLTFYDPSTTWFYKLYKTLQISCNLMKKIYNNGTKSYYTICNIYQNQITTENVNFPITKVIILVFHRFFCEA